ncbi:MAG: hypothetical protein COB35_12965 [Gammaproteobacteria bacterium]|nr:MAG: hypothetical protein COB35_12965 [Gammaproteobacteria bacterium]
MQINILKKAQYGKVSTPEKETLTYNIGNIDGDFYFRITDNIGGGYFSNEWLNLNDIAEHLPNDTPFNASALAPLFKSKSTNNAGFMAAALKAESLLHPVKDTKRLHTLGDLTALNKAMQKLIKSNVSLSDEIAERETVKAAKRKALAEKLEARKLPTKNNPTK